MKITGQKTRLDLTKKNLPELGLLSLHLRAKQAGIFLSSVICRFGLAG